MTILPNGCYHTEVWVSPDDWKTTKAKSSLAKNWYVQCNYYDPAFSDKYPNGFPFRRKLNKLKTLDARRGGAELLLVEIPKLLNDMGYNPITKTFAVVEEIPEVIEVVKEHTEMLPETPFMKALELAKNSKKLADSTSSDIYYMLERISVAVEMLEMDKYEIYKVQRKHIRLIFAYLEENEKSFSAHKFNKYRGYLSILWNELTEFEAVNGNIIDGIQKRVHEKKIRETLTESERISVNTHLKDNFPDFWRFTIIFFHSGGRIRELLDLKTEHVNLANQKYRTLIKKGGKNVWVERVIKDIAIPFWIKSLYNAQNGDYIFSRGLVPGPTRIRREQIDRRWRIHVKEKLNVTADFYALKHLNLDETSALLSIADAAKMASHTSTRMVEKHYAVGENERQMERLKSIGNVFA